MAARGRRRRGRPWSLPVTSRATSARCGLTPKHVDVPELLRIADFTELADPVRPAVDGRFAVSVPDFALAELDLTGSAHVGDTGPAIVLCIDAGGRVEAFDSAVDLARGQAAFVGDRDA